MSRKVIAGCWLGHYAIIRHNSVKCLPMLKHVVWNEVELEKLNPLLHRQMITGENLMLARVLLKKGCVVPEHSHVNEQLTYIVEGALKFWIGTAFRNCSRDNRTTGDDTE